MIQSLSEKPVDAVECNRPTDANVVVLNNFLGPHHWKQMRACGERVKKLSVLLSTEMEPNRTWAPDWEGLDVHVQKNLMLTRKWRHKSGFEEDNYIHIPWDTIRQLKALKPDVILSYEMGIRTLMSSRYRASHKNCRLVMVANVSEQTEQGRGRLRPMLRSYLRKRVDYATYNGPSCRRYLLDLGFREDQLLHFPYIHDNAKVWQGTNRTFNDFPERLFYCGSLSERKGIVRFCHALCKWCTLNPERKIEFVMAGDGPLKLVLETMIVPPNLNLVLLGNIGPAQLRDEYGKADLGAFPTLADEWGLVVNESLASGLPLLSSVLAQSTESLVRDNVNGWGFDPTDDDSLSAALEIALKTPGERLQQMSESAIASASHLTMKQNADCFQHIIETANPRK